MTQHNQKKSKQTRVRFAPSPTGYLHLGSARTALYNFLFARNTKGVFILRIEDTDQVRSKQEYLDEILEDLKWLGLDWDQGPYYQTERKQIYADFADKLLKKGQAYKDEGALRFRMNKERVRVNDLIRGQVDFDASLLEDLVIIKSNGLPAYNFACVVDDIQMNITHVIRGDDHLSNTPKQAAMYQALGYPVPVFAHIPLILGQDRSPLSKRHNATAIKMYREQGFLPGAMINYMSLLGWSAGDDKEIMDKDELIKKFSLDRVNKTGAIFDIEKLKWINAEYIYKLSFSELAGYIRPVLEKAGFSKGIKDEQWLMSFCELFQKRIKVFSDIVESARYFFVDDIEYESQAKEKYLNKEGVGVLLGKWARRLGNLENFNTEEIEADCRQLAQELGLKAGEIIHPARAALTGRAAAPGLFEIMALLGRERCLSRLTNLKI